MIKHIQLTMLLCLGSMIYAEQLELQNKSSSSIKAMLGSASNAPSARKARFIVPGERVTATVSSYDKPQLLILKGDDKQVFQLNIKPGQNANLDVVSSYAGKVDLVPQSVPNNITKQEMVLISSGSDTYTPQPEPSYSSPYGYVPTQPQPPMPSPPLALPAPEPVTPHTLLGISQNASDAQILGVDQAMIDLAKLGVGTAKNTIKKAYLKLSLIWHPDKINSSTAKNILVQNGITDSEQQKKAAEKVFTLISNTYNKYK